jgi:hypothetical protein
MAKQQLVSTFDLTQGGDRADFEELIAGGDRVLQQQDFPLGNGSIIRVIDHEHDDKKNSGFQYKPPVC